MSAPVKGDVVAVRDRDIGQLRRVYPWLSASDTLTVTRVDRGSGKKAVYCRKVGAVDHVAVVWPEQVRVVRRAPAPRGRRP